MLTYWYYKSVIDFTACGGIFKSSTGFIMSPNFPRNYGPNTNCEWLIETDPIHRLELDFESIALETSNNCQHDSVKVGTNKKFGVRIRNPF